MDPLREAAQTIRAYVDPLSDQCLVPSPDPSGLRYVQVSLLELARDQLTVLEQLLDGRLQGPPEFMLPIGLSSSVDRTIQCGDQVYEWRQLAAVMVAADHLLQFLGDDVLQRKQDAQRS